MANLSEYIEQLNDLDFSDIDWERVGVWPLPVRIFLCVVAAVVILVGSYFLIIKDKNAALVEAESKEVTLKESFEKKAFEASNLEKYRLQMIEMEESFGALVKQLPSDTEVPGLLDDIDEKGKDSDLEITSIDMQPEKPSEFYVELPIDIRVVGGYHEFGTFVSSVAGMPRIVTLHDFEIGESKDGRLSMRIQARTYRYKDQDEE